MFSFQKQDKNRRIVKEGSKNPRIKDKTRENNRKGLNHKGSITEPMTTGKIRQKELLYT